MARLDMRPHNVLRVEHLNKLVTQLCCSCQERPGWAVANRGKAPQSVLDGLSVELRQQLLGCVCHSSQQHRPCRMAMGQQL